MSSMPIIQREDILAGTSNSDDAGIIQLSEELAIIQTIDIFTPVVDDPYMYGRIAAANSISDIYAMGGKPISALNFIGFPVESHGLDMMAEVLRGGYDKAAEAGVAIIGGHSIKDKEPKYGLAVTGIVHPDNIITNSGAKPGDKLFLTKPIGTGILSTAIKQGKADADVEKRISAIMEELNNTAAELAVLFEINACTDITGFGLMGHAYEMAKASGVKFRIEYNAVPFIDGALDYCKAGTVPAGSVNNKEFMNTKYKLKTTLSEAEEMLLFDAQTSGGLLIAVVEDDAVGFNNAIKAIPNTTGACIGEVISGEAGTFEIV